MLPLIKVPRKYIPVNLIEELAFELELLYIAYTIIEVTILSIMFGSWPPGNDVVRAHKAPATIPVMRVILKSFVRIIDKIINTNKKSGFIPKNMPGVIWCSIRPIARNREVIIILFVFI